ncbi:MAG: DUF2520 domain-containing protein [Planctomycetes bacterium]|nr:DUF2520 domain-containing protein [Planctomycetota bacterium]
MSLRLVIVGPGRVGAAMARRFVQAGVDVVGLVGRDPERTAAAVRWSGARRAATWADLPPAHVVVFAVGDPDLPAAVAAAVAHGAARRCALWLHTSGRHGLEVLAPAAVHGIRRGALHPLLPFADAAAGAQAMAGAPAVCEGDARSLRLLRRLCDRLGMVPIVPTRLDRGRYHAACALAANGTTALRALVDAAFTAAGGLAPDERRVGADALMAAALAACSERGAGPALSGPVRRGDAATVALHVAALAAASPRAAAAYRVLMQEALALAEGQGLGAALAAAVREALAATGEAGG